eukprot:TRINITY_DN1090_c0_g2_i4.p1 TRINITY_DN1090_c0_g2~~TRINITY_DN1090_c0_g2_i4.p1  ORF type:complete len:188 (+),score=16.47 TRINITY_DN1090_c0_g2_i4:348-911(+)
MEGQHKQPGGCKRNVACPTIIKKYSLNHNYTDRMKAHLSNVRNVHRASHFWRAKLNAMIYGVNYASYICYCFDNSTDPIAFMTKYRFSDFLVDLTSQCASHRFNSFTPDPSYQQRLTANQDKTIINHPLTSKKKVRRACQAPLLDGNSCKNKKCTYYCNECEVYLCPGDCSLRFHNPGLLIDRGQQQ